MTSPDDTIPAPAPIDFCDEFHGDDTLVDFEIPLDDESLDNE